MFRSLGNSGYGCSVYENQTLNSINAYGTARIVGTTVQGSVHVSGNVDIARSTLETANINGRAALEDTTVNGSLTINGYLEANSSRIGSISIASENATLSNTRVGSIDVRRTSASSAGQPQVIALTGNTRVTGNVHFEQDGGELRAGPNVQIDGQVSGGSVVRQTPQSGPSAL